MTTPKIAFIIMTATLAYLGLAVLSWGGFAAFFSHAALSVLVIASIVMAGTALFTAGNLSSGEREDRNRLSTFRSRRSNPARTYLPAATPSS